MIRPFKYGIRDKGDEMNIGIKDMEFKGPARDEKSRYYDAGNIETLDIIKAKLTPEQYEGYLLGNVLKYTCRMMHKETPIRDAEKAANYARWLHEAMK